jgi:hypothetical protein
MHPDLTSFDSTCYFCTLNGDHYDYGVYERTHFSTPASQKVLGKASSFEEGIASARRDFERIKGTIYDTIRAKCDCKDSSDGYETENDACCDLA